MGYRFAFLAGAAAIGLALLRLDRLVADAETGLPWTFALLAAAMLGALITWIALSYRIGAAGIVGANLLFFSLAAVRIGAPDESVLGVFPTWTTFEVLQEELSLAIDTIRFGSPPVEPLAGLLVILAALFWLLGVVLSWGLAMRRPAVALVPPLLFYLQLATIDRLDPGRIWVLAVMVLVAASFLAVAFDERRQGGRLRRAVEVTQLPAMTAKLPALFVAIPTIAAVVAMGALSGWVDEAGVIGWRRGGLGGGGIAAGVSFNIFAGILQDKLVADSDTEVFRAQITGDVDPSRLYFRMTTFDTYDGQHFFPGTQAGRRPEVGEPWGDTQHVQAGNRTRVLQRIEIAALHMTILPALAEPLALETTNSLIDRTLRVREDASLWIQARTRRGNSYDVVSDVAVPDISGLATLGQGLSPVFREASAAGATDLVPNPGPRIARPDDIDRFLELPDGLHAAIPQEAAGITEGGSTNFERGLFLEKYFRNTGGFTYSTVTEGHGAQDLAEWLFDPLSENYRVGWCEQFATAMAVMARSIGIPSRVIFGFTPGDVAGDVVIVREKHGHAWVELWVDGHGWVPFDPTPRSDGQNAATAMGSQIGFDPLAYIPPPLEEVPLDDGIEGSLRDTRAQPILEQLPPIPPIVIPGTGISVPGWLWVLTSVAVLTAITPSIKWVRRRRRLERLHQGDIGAAWAEITDRLRDLGSPVSSHQTPLEVARSTDSSLGPLAHEYGRTTYGPPRPPSPASIDVATRSFVAIESHLRGEHPWSRRAWSWIRPGSLRG
ncbi:MAG: transglutaminaseTgpA domain-containing protein [Acidimicrobiia bacterium]